MNDTVERDTFEGKATASRLRLSPRSALIASFLPLCWLGMMIVHEFGHVLGAWLCGATVTKVVLHPLAISRTDVEGSSATGFIVWSGPLAGSLVPLLVWLIPAVRQSECGYLLRFFAGFCLVANGGYLAAGAVGEIGDARQLLENGTPAWLLIVFGVVTIPVGFVLWHGQGREFGFGPQARTTTWKSVCPVLLVLVVTVVLELLLSPRR